MTIKLSIIVPVYNVEKYIRPCIESIFKQRLDDKDFEVIIVNDGTEDRSMEVITDIINTHQNIRIINQKNQGLSVARNNGLEIANGKYILFIDSDDMLVSQSVPYLLNIAISKGPNLVVADFLKMNDHEIEIFQQKTFQQRDGIVQEETGNDMLLRPPYSGFSCVWHTLFKRDFLIDNNIRFIPHIYYEDTPFTMQCYAKAGKCLKVNWLLNIYRRGHESATFSFNLKKVRDFCTAIAKTWELTHLDGLSIKVQDKLQEDVYTSFSMMTWVTTHKIASASDRIDVIDYMKRQAPDLWFRIGIRQKVVSYLYRYFPHLFIRLRYFYAIIVENNIRPFINHRLKKLFSEI